MKVIQYMKRLKRVMAIVIDNNTQLAIAWDIINDITTINWSTLNGKQTTLTAEQERKYIKYFKDYATNTKQYKEIIERYK